MSFITMKGRSPDNRLDGTIKYMQDMHVTITNRIDTAVEAIRAVHETTSDKISELNDQIRQLEDQREYMQNVLHTLNRDVKKLESKPDPVIPLMPDLTPLRTEQRLLRSVIDEVVISHNNEMTELWKNLQEIHEVRSDLDKRIDGIKIPNLTPLYTLIAIITVLVGVALYV